MMMGGLVMDIVAIDIGGTNVRFAIAEVGGGRVSALGEAVTLKTGDYASLASAWKAFAAKLGKTPPHAAALAVAGPVSGNILKLTNSSWVIRTAALAKELGVKKVTLVNDFGAIGHAVAHIGPEYLRHLSGPDIDLPSQGVISIVGPGTGLGVAHVLRRKGHYFVMECEGGHIDFPPLDTVEDAILARLRLRYRRVSAERIISGPGLANIYEALAAIEGHTVSIRDDTALWNAALEGSDSLAAAALERFCLSLGAIAGDIVLAQGAGGLVIAGGIGPRIADMLPHTGFASRFTAKGRFERMMATIPIKLITHPQPGLFGVAAAFAEEHTS
jgi:glucokinase